VWTGNLRSGKGRIDSESGVLKDERYDFGTRFEDIPGTNPEELIAAGHAACYSMAFAHTLAEKGYQPERIETRATCTVSPQKGGGFRITTMHLQVRGKVPGIDEGTLRQIAHEADQGCPVSNLLRGGAKIELDIALM
jgi:osmotically inducible protein OsmC